MSYFIFNDKRSDDMGLIVRKSIIRPQFKEEKVSVKIPGRPQVHTQKTGVYPDITFTVNTSLMDAGIENLHKIYQWLGDSGILVISTASGEYLSAEIEPLVPEAVAYLTAEIPISITAHPFANATDPTVFDITKWDVSNSTVIFDNLGTVFSEPLFTITPTVGDTNETSLYSNGNWFKVRYHDEIVNSGGGYQIVVDCENKICYFIRPDGTKVNCTQCTVGSFPRLEVGQNEVGHTGCLSKLMINLKERWL